MRIAILKDKRVVSVIDLHKYILEAIVRAHGGDTWLELHDVEADPNMQNLRAGDMIFSERDSEGVPTLVVHPKQ